MKDKRIIAVKVSKEEAPSNLQLTPEDALKVITDEVDRVVADKDATEEDIANTFYFLALTALQTLSPERQSDIRDCLNFFLTEE